MRHNKKRLKFNRDKGHKDAMLRNLATSIILYEKVKTTKT
ncbi:MAG: 50S ribosomal protein L17, partial [Candidatus Peregrinibacteria bacterium GW2011_GWA2_33_10]